MPLTTYPVNRVHGQGRNLVYYIRTPPCWPPRGCWHVAASKTWLACHLRHAFSIFVTPKASSLFAHLSLRLWPLAYLTSCKTWQIILRVDIINLRSQLAGLLEVSFTQRRRLAANSNPSNARFNPDEPNLWSLTSPLPKVSPPWVGVETELHSLLLSLFAKRLTRNIILQLVMLIPYILIESASRPPCRFWRIDD
jgi:hypothetical protein